MNFITTNKDVVIIKISTNMYDKIYFQRLGYKNVEVEVEGEENMFEKDLVEEVQQEGQALSKDIIEAAFGPEHPPNGFTELPLQTQRNEQSVIVDFFKNMFYGKMTKSTKIPTTVTFRGIKHGMVEDLKEKIDASIENESIYRKKGLRYEDIKGIKEDIKEQMEILYEKGLILRNVEKGDMVKIGKKWIIVKETELNEEVAKMSIDEFKRLEYDVIESFLEEILGDKNLLKILENKK